MCIAIYKPQNVKMPSKETLKICFNNNPDGAGYMLLKNGKIYGKKGFMTFKSFWSSFNAEGYTQKDSVAIHFRIGTSGELSESFTHPFPISDKPKELKKLSFVSNMALIHNGIIGAGTKEMSDTMLFIKDVLFPLSNHFEKDEIIQAISGMTKGNRLLIVKGHKVVMTGDWQKNEGVYYSNDTYKKEKTYFQWSKPLVKYGHDYVTKKHDYYDYDDAFLDEICPYCGVVTSSYYDKYDEAICEHCGIKFDKYGNILSVSTSDDLELLN